MAHEGQTGIYFESGGYRLLGTLFLTRDTRPKPTAVLLHGLPGIEKNYDLAHVLRDHGWNSLIFHYRGCWGSEGEYVFETIPVDVRRAVDVLSSGKYPQVDSERMVLIGHSLGGWAGVLAAADDSRVRGVAVYGSVTSPHLLQFSVEDAATEFTPWLQGITPESLVAQWNGLGTAYDPLEHVADIAPRPLLILHGGQDPVVPVAHAQALYERAREPAQFVEVPGANHAWAWHRKELHRHILTWLDALEV